MNKVLIYTLTLNFILLAHAKDICDRDVFTNYIASLTGDTQALCNAAWDEEGSESYEQRCACFTAIDQSFIAENFNCYWDADTPRTMMEEYSEECSITAGPYSCFPESGGDQTCSHTDTQTFTCDVGAGSTDFRYMGVPAITGDFEATWTSTVTDHTTSQPDYGTLISLVDTQGTDCFRLTTNDLKLGTCNDNTEHSWSLTRTGSTFEVKCDDVVQASSTDFTWTCDNGIIKFVAFSHRSGEFCRLKGTFKDLMVKIPDCALDLGSNGVVVDGSFEALRSVAATSENYHLNSNVNGAGWHNGVNTADSLLAPLITTNPSTTTHNVPESPDGGVFAGAAALPDGRYTESFWTEIEGLTAGTSYNVNFWQSMTADQIGSGDGRVAPGNEGAWEVHFGDSVQLSPAVTYLGMDHESVWTPATLTFTATRETEKIEFFSKTVNVAASPQDLVYILVDGITVTPNTPECRDPTNCNLETARNNPQCLTSMCPTLSSDVNACTIRNGAYTRVEEIDLDNSNCCLKTDCVFECVAREECDLVRFQSGSKCLRNQGNNANALWWDCPDVSDDDPLFHFTIEIPDNLKPNEIRIKNSNGQYLSYQTGWDGWAMTRDLHAQYGQLWIRETTAMGGVTFKNIMTDFYLSTDVTAQCQGSTCMAAFTTTKDADAVFSSSSSGICPDVVTGCTIDVAKKNSDCPVAGCENPPDFEADCSAEKGEIVTISQHTNTDSCCLVNCNKKCIKESDWYPGTCASQGSSVYYTADKESRSEATRNECLASCDDNHLCVAAEFNTVTSECNHYFGSFDVIDSGDCKNTDWECFPRSYTEWPLECPSVGDCISNMDNCEAQCAADNPNIPNTQVAVEGGVCTCSFTTTLTELAGSVDGTADVDMFILMDATSSMQSQIDALKDATQDLVANVAADIQRTTGFNAVLRVGVIAYRDPFDEWTNANEVLDFTTDLAVVDTFLENIVAQGGGDWPEDVNGGLRVALDQTWTGTHKFIVHISDDSALGLDNPPDAAGLDYRDLFAEVNAAEISYIFGRAGPNADPMIVKFNEVYTVTNPIPVFDLQGKSVSEMSEIMQTELVDQIVSDVITRDVAQVIGTYRVCETTLQPTVAPATVDDPRWIYCVSHGDPHIRSFTNNFFDDVDQDGDRILFSYDKITVITTQQRNIYNARATITEFRVEVDASQVMHFTRDQMGDDFGAKHARIRGPTSYSEWPRSSFPGEFSDMIEFDGVPDFALFWSVKSVSRNGGYIDIGVRWAGDVSMVVGQCGPNPIGGRVPVVPDSICTNLSECCKRYNAIDVLEKSCQIDFSEECCDVDGADATCCDTFSPPDCTDVGCGNSEECDTVSRTCRPITPTTTVAPTTTTVRPLTEATFCVSWGDPHLITHFGSFDDVVSDGERVFFHADGIKVTTTQRRGVVNSKATIVSFTVSDDDTGITADIDFFDYNVRTPLVYMELHNNDMSYTHWPRSHYPTTFMHMITFPGAPDVVVFWRVIAHGRSHYIDVGVKYYGDVNSIIGQCGPTPDSIDIPDTNRPTCQALDTCCAPLANNPNHPSLEAACKADAYESCCVENEGDSCCDFLMPPGCDTTGCGDNEQCSADTLMCQPDTPRPTPTLPIPPEVTIDLTAFHYCVSWGDPHIIRNDNFRFDDVREAGNRTMFSYRNIEIITKQDFNLAGNTNAVITDVEVWSGQSRVFAFNVNNGVQQGADDATQLSTAATYANWPRSRYPYTFKWMFEIDASTTLFWSSHGSYVNVGIRYSPIELNLISGQCGSIFIPEISVTPPECPALNECCSVFRGNTFQPSLEADCKLDTFQDCCADDSADASTCCGSVVPPTCDITGCGQGELCGEQGFCIPMTAFPTPAPVPDVDAPVTIEDFDYCVSWGDPHIITFDNRRFDDKATDGTRTFFEYVPKNGTRFTIKTVQAKHIVNANAVIRSIEVYDNKGQIYKINVDGFAFTPASLNMDDFGVVTPLSNDQSYEQWPRSQYPTVFSNMLVLNDATDFAIFWRLHGAGNARYQGGWFDLGVRFGGDVNKVLGQCGNFPVPTDTPTPRPDTLCAAVTKCCGQFANDPFNPTLEDDCIADYYEECCDENVDDCCAPMRPPSCLDTRCDNRFEVCNKNTEMCEPLTPYPTREPTEPSGTCATFECNQSRAIDKNYIDPISVPNWILKDNADSISCPSGGCDDTTCCRLRDFGLDWALADDQICVTMDPNELIQAENADFPWDEWCPPGLQGCGSPAAPSGNAPAGSECKRNGMPSTSGGPDQTCQDNFLIGNRLYELCMTVDNKVGFCGSCGLPKCRCLGVSDNNGDGGLSQGGYCTSKGVLRDQEPFSTGYWCYTTAGACADSSPVAAGVTSVGDDTNLATYQRSYAACDDGDVEAWNDPVDPITNMDDLDHPEVVTPTACTSSDGNCDDLMTGVNARVTVQVDHTMTFTYDQSYPFFALRLVSSGIERFEAKFSDGSSQYFEVDTDKDGKVVYYRLHPSPRTNSVQITVVSTRDVTVTGGRRNLSCSPTNPANCAAWLKVDATTMRCIPNFWPCPENQCHSMFCDAAIQKCADDVGNMPAAGTPCGSGANTCDGDGACGGDPRSCANYISDGGVCSGLDVVNEENFCEFSSCQTSVDQKNCCESANCYNTHAESNCQTANKIVRTHTDLRNIPCVDASGLASDTCLLDTCCETILCDNFAHCSANEPVKVGQDCGLGCTQDICCGDATTCASDGFTEAGCNANEKLKPFQDSITCQTTDCTNSECCQTVTCALIDFQCAQNRERKDDLECTDRDCDDTCCKPAKTCGDYSFNCGALRADSPADKACTLLECVLDDCCEPPQTCDGYTGCNAISNRRLIDNPDLKTCTTLACSDDECCTDPQTCDFNFPCDPNRFREPATKECGSLVCTADECCGPKQTCATSWTDQQCGDTRIPFTNPAAHDCTTTSCDEDDCCEAESTCDGYACPANQPPLMPQINFKCGTAAQQGICNDDQCCGPVQTCDAYTGCDTIANRELIDNPGVKTCTTLACSVTECCTAPKTCEVNFACNPNQFREPATTECATLVCTADECCQDPQTCASGWTPQQCGDTRKPLANQALQECTTTTCVADDCCEAESTCDGFNCPANRPRLMPQSNHKCGTATQQGVCNVDQCCEPIPTCQSSPVTCPGGMALPNPAFIECTAATCTVEDCCGQSCSQYQQSTGTTCAASNKQLDTTKYCSGAVCQTSDASQCCVPTTCANSGATCPNVPSGRTLIDNPQNKVCAGATCTQDECCKPAWNNWGTPSQCIPNDNICGNGVQKRVRTCVGGSATNTCSGPSEETSNCHIPCEQKELYCWWHGDPHILPFVSTAIVTRAHDCGACGYNSNPQWQPYFHATKAGVGTIQIDIFHDVSPRPVARDVRVRINNVDVYIYSSNFNARSSRSPNQCRHINFNRRLDVTWNNAIEFPQFPEIKVIWANQHVIGILFNGQAGFRGYTQITGLCCYGNRCTNRRNLQESDLQPEPLTETESIVDPTCPRQEECCQRYRNVDHLYKACLVDMVDQCCLNEDQDKYVAGDLCCKVPASDLCAIDTECPDTDVCEEGLCLKGIPATVDMCKYRWTTWTDCSATCGNGVKTRTMTITEDRATDAGIPCPYEDGHEDEQQCTRGPCAADLCEDMNCVREADGYPCQERVGICTDVSDLYNGLRKAQCVYINKPDGTSCPEGSCLEGECIYVSPKDASAVDPASDDSTNYQTAFFVMIGVSVVLLLLLCGLYFCKVGDGEESSKDVEVEMGEQKRMPNITLMEDDRLPVAMGSPSTGGMSTDGDARLAIQQAGLNDNDTNLTQYDDIDFVVTTSGV